MPIQPTGVVKCNEIVAATERFPPLPHNNNLITTIRPVRMDRVS